ncbi:MAG: hypothetical protein IT557_06760 [Alphaproteobacteria bacterium]|nr:hypothetical protein [Alphaproteobacteria bacterium]
MVKRLLGGVRGPMRVAGLLLAAVLAACAQGAAAPATSDAGAKEQRLGSLAYRLPDGRNWRQIPTQADPPGLVRRQVEDAATYGTLVAPGHTIFVRLRTLAAPNGAMPADGLDRVFTALAAAFRSDPRITVVHRLRPEGERQPHPGGPASRIGACRRADLGGEDTELRDAERRPFVYRAALYACESAGRSLVLTAELSERGPLGSLGSVDGFLAEAGAVFSRLAVRP